MARNKLRSRPFHIPTISGSKTEREDSRQTGGVDKDQTPSTCLYLLPKQEYFGISMTRVKGIQIDEPSSPISKHYGSCHGNNGKLSWQDSTTVASSRSPSHISYIGNNLSRSSCQSLNDKERLPKQQYIDNAVRSSSRVGTSKKGDMKNEKNTEKTMSDFIDDKCCSNAKEKHNINDLNVTFTLEEDEGLGIRDSDSSLYKGDYFNSHNSKHETDSSNEYSDDTEISENVDSIELTEVSVELSELSSRDGVESCAQDDERRRTKDAKKKRFHRLMRKPAIKRSQSLGCEKDLVPEHALFLQFNPGDFHGTESSEKDKNDTQRRTIYKTSSADAAMMAEEVLPLDTQEKSKHRSSIAKNVRRRLQKLHRRNTDSLLGAAIMSIKGSKVTQAEALEWGNSFETLLSDKNGLDMFRNFLKSEFSEENIEFWIACEEYKTTRTNKLASRAQKIYSDFVATNAPKQINLDSKTRLETVKNLDNPTRDLFQQAQKRIQFLMENDSYKRFLETDTYKNLIQSTAPST